MCCGQHQAPGIASSEFGTRSLEIFRFTQDVFGDAQYRLARFGYAGKAFATTLKNLHTQFILEQFYLLGNTRLRGKQSLRRFRYIEALTLNFDDVT